jgi:hypothetical protein
MPTAPNDGQEYFALGPAAPNSGVVAPYAVPAMTRADITLTAAQLKALYTTPVTLAVAPPTGFYINPIFAVIRYNYGGVAYGGSTGVMQLIVGTAVLGPAILTLSSTNIAVTASSLETISLTSVLSTAAPVTSGYAAGALTVNFSSANATSGTGTVHISVYYTIEPTT